MYTFCFLYHNQTETYLSCLDTQQLNLNIVPVSVVSFELLVKRVVLQLPPARARFLLQYFRLFLRLLFL